MSTRTIDIFLITGFLGSGKTTFLRYLLDQLIFFPEVKIGVLMNEFGSINVDKELIPQDRIVFTEINGGSIFCNCLHSEFIEALKLFYESSGVNTLFLETSGLSNPSVILQDLNIVNNQIGNVYKVRESICLVDASLVMKLLHAFPNITTQLEVSSQIIINKIDLINLDDLDYIKQSLCKINPNAKISTTEYGQFKLQNLVLQDEIQRSKISSGKRDVKGKISSVTITQSKLISKKEFSIRMREIRDYPIRVKGYIQLEDRGWHRVDQVDNRYLLTRVSSHPDQGSLVFILRDKDDIKIIRSQFSSLISCD